MVVKGKKYEEEEEIIKSNPTNNDEENDEPNKHSYNADNDGEVKKSTDWDALTRKNAEQIV